MSFNDLQNPNTVAYYAAALEAEQASRDFHVAFVAMLDDPRVSVSHEYALTSLGGYQEAADRLVRDMPVWEVNA